MLRLGSWAQIHTSRSGSRTGRDRKSTAFTTLKMAVLAPIPKARANVAAAVKPGYRANVRSPKRASSRRFRMPGLFFVRHRQAYFRSDIPQGFCVVRSLTAAAQQDTANANTYLSIRDQRARLFSHRVQKFVHIGVAVVDRGRDAHVVPFDLDCDAGPPQLVARALRVFHHEAHDRRGVVLRRDARVSLARQFLADACGKPAGMR